MVSRTDHRNFHILAASIIAKAYKPIYIIANMRATVIKKSFDMTRGAISGNFSGGTRGFLGHILLKANPQKWGEGQLPPQNGAPGYYRCARFVNRHCSCHSSGFE